MNMTCSVFLHWRLVGGLIVLLTLSACGAGRLTTGANEARATAMSTATPVATFAAPIAPTVDAASTDATANDARPTATAGPTPTAYARLADEQDNQAARVPGIAERNARFAEALTQDPPVLRIDERELTAGQQIAQEVALTDLDVTQYAYSLVDGARLRNEVFNIFPARPADMSAEDAAACADGDCYRVEIYNYGANLTVVAIVDAAAERVVGQEVVAGSQPEVPASLGDLALQIALNAPAVEEELGFKPTDAVMPNVKTALNDSSCENSRHLCVAPTFIVNDRALWAVVDLTDLRLVGVRWTDLGNVNAPATSERSVVIETLAAEACGEETLVERGDWSLAYLLTTSDGLRVSDVRYQGKPVMRSAKLVDWHVNYSREEQFGYSDSTGCPLLSTFTTIVASTLPQVEPIVAEGEEIGFAVMQEFTHHDWPMPCNYRYEQRYEFYHDGRFRVVVGNLGRGCGNDGTYRPILRLDLNGDDAATFSAWDGREWAPWQEEQWAEQTDASVYTDEGYRYRVDFEDGRGYYIEPGQGQFEDGGRGDFAYTYVTEYARREGDGDMVSLGSCCNENYAQGPEIFIDTPPADITEREIVLWYVPQLKNDDTPGEEYCWAEQVVVDGLFDGVAWPCYAGPMFVPVE
jgi:hypothetical protein